MPFTKRYHIARHSGGMTVRQQRGRHANARGVSAEAAASRALESDGWVVLRRRLRTQAGEIDLLAERDGVLAIVEVKARPRLADAAAAVSFRQRARLLAAADIILAEHPDWGAAGVRIDVLAVDAAGRVRRIVDAFRAGDEPGG
ncbi:MAG TPA: YraN family protein [Acetobacteraceae bacterium]|nr:YraN family protein [Acetobacteraceae bacterium]